MLYSRDSEWPILIAETFLSSEDPSISTKNHLAQPCLFLTSRLTRNIPDSPGEKIANSGRSARDVFTQTGSSGGISSTYLIERARAREDK